MSFNIQLKSATSGVQFFDTGAAFTQGQRAYAAAFEATACPFKIERERKPWLAGWRAERDRLQTLFAKWRTEDRGTR